MTGLGPGLKSTGWPNASCTEPCVNTWRFGSTCEERSEAAGVLVDAAFAGGVPAAAVGEAGSWAANNHWDGDTAQATTSADVASNRAI
jgi:hypothetical protein